MVIVESRKLQKTKSTLTVSLPSTWIHDSALEKGDIVDLVVYDEDQGFISVVPSSETRMAVSKVANLSISDAEHDMLSSREKSVREKAIRRTIRLLVSCYIVGYDDILINTSKQELPFELFEELKNFVINERRLYGVRFSPLAPNSLILHVHAKPTGVSVRNTLKEIFETIKVMYSQVMRLMDTYSQETADSIDINDTYVDQYNRYIVRMCKLAAKNPRLLVDLNIRNVRHMLCIRLLSKRCELIADVFQDISFALSDANKSNVTLHPDIRAFAKEECKKAMDIMEHMIEELLANRYSFNEADTMIESADEIVSRIKNRLLEHRDSNINQEGKLTQTLVLQNMRRIADDIIACAEIIQNISIESYLQDQS